MGAIGDPIKLRRTSDVALAYCALLSTNEKDSEKVLALPVSVARGVVKYESVVGAKHSGISTEGSKPPDAWEKGVVPLRRTTLKLLNCD